MAAPHLLVLGGGYAAIQIARSTRAAVKAGRLRVTVVNRENFHVFHGFVGEMVTGRVSPSHILSPSRRLFRPAQVHVGEIQRVDLGARTVTTARSLDGARQTLEYDQLAVCLGTADRTEAYPGLAEHSYRLKTYEDCLALKNHIVEMFELAEIERDPAERRRLLTFFVAGGGYAGTEVAGELADLARLLTSGEYRGIRREECRFVLVHPGPTILPELYGKDGTGPEAHPKLVEYGMRRMRELGVEVLTETRVEAATPNEVCLSNGERIPTRTIVSAVGTTASPIVEALPVEKDERGRIVTDACCRVPGHDGVWAAGDCAAVPLPKAPGAACPQVALYALKHGNLIGRNVVRGLDGKPPKRFTFPGLGQGASVGRRSGVGELRGIELKGFPAWLIWRLLLVYYFPTWDRRLRLLADWAIWPIVGRDIVELRSERAGEYDIRHNVFQPGETIAQEERTGKYIHVIVEGEVELLLRQDGMEQVLDTLGPGAHFGTRWMESFELETARAKTLVRTVALRRDQAPALQQVLASAGQLSAESGHFPAIVDADRGSSRVGMPSAPRPPEAGG
jgi:NADH:ubiquinone reductase (H+-translocating)